MSILQEYEMIQGKLNKEQSAELDIYLKFHPEIVLSDFYYNRQHWDACQECRSLYKKTIPSIV